MSTKPNVPSEIFLGNQEYSWRSDCSVNGWLMVATLISGCSDVIFASAFAGWPLAWRVAVVLAQFAALAFWVRSLNRWIRDMDEMHRRITTAAVLFSVSAAFFVVLLWHRFVAIGLFEALLPSAARAQGNWDIATVGHCSLLLTLFYIIGHNFFNRRYR